jgi:hypothetical protein
MWWLFMSAYAGVHMLSAPLVTACRAICLLRVYVFNVRQRVAVNMQRSMLEERGLDVCICEAMTLFSRIYKNMK